jgi:hypothetical protein
MDGKRILLLLLFSLVGDMALSDAAMTEVAKSEQSAAVEDSYAADPVIWNACRWLAQGDEKQRDATCDPLLANVDSTSRMNKPTRRGLPLGKYFEASKPDVVQQPSLAPIAGVADSGSRVVAKPHGGQPKPAVEGEPSPDVRIERASSVSVRREVIPGSLLVTILALVGIVAVARRDMPEKRIPRMIGHSGSEVARIAPLRHNRRVISDQMSQL